MSISSFYRPWLKTHQCQTKPWELIEPTLKEYCNLADHIHCLNPASVTGKSNDGERWLKRDETGRQKRYYYIMSVKKAEELQNAMKTPDEPELAF